MTNYNITALHYATQEVPGPQAYWQQQFDQWTTYNYYVFVLESADRTILLDAGMDDLRAFNRFAEEGLGPRGLVRLERPVMELLAERGIDPSDIDDILVTHFHADHCWNLPLFPNARYMVSRRGWQDLLRLRKDRPAMTPEPLFPTHVLHHVEADPDRLVLLPDGPSPIPGIEVRHVGGHTVDSTGWLIQTATGIAVSCSDTISMYRNVEENVPVGSNVNLEACYDAMEWASTAGTIQLPCHDPQLLQRNPDGQVTR